MTAPLFMATAASPAMCVAATPNFVQCCSAHEDGTVQEYDWFSSINRAPGRASESSALVMSSPAMYGRWTSIKPDVVSPFAKNLAKVSESPDPITAVAIHNEGVWLLTGHRSGKIQLFTSRIAKGMLHYTNSEHKESIAGISLVKNQTIAIIASSDGCLSALDLNTSKFILLRPEDKSPESKFLQRFTSLEAETTEDAIKTYLATTTEGGTVSVWVVSHEQTNTPVLSEIAITLKHECQLQTQRIDAVAAAWTTTTTKEPRKLIIGYRSGDVEKWDLSNTKSPTKQCGFSIPPLFESDNSIQAVRPLRNCVAVAVEDCVRIYEWATVIRFQEKLKQKLNKKKRKRHIPCTVLLESAGVTSMVTCREGRFLLVNPKAFGQNVGQNSNGLACLGYDLTEIVGLEYARLPLPVTKHIVESPEKSTNPSVSSPIESGTSAPPLELENLESIIDESIGEDTSMILGSLFSSDNQTQGLDFGSEAVETSLLTNLNNI